MILALQLLVVTFYYIIQTIICKDYLLSQVIFYARKVVVRRYRKSLMSVLA